MTTRAQKDILTALENLSGVAERVTMYIGGTKSVHNQAVFEDLLVKIRKRVQKECKKHGVHAIDPQRRADVEFWVNGRRPDER